MSDYYTNLQKELDRTVKKMNKYRAMLDQYQNGETVSVKLLHRAMVDAMYEQRINSREMEKFIEIICDCKWIEDYEYRQMTEPEEKEEEPEKPSVLWRTFR